MFSSAANGGIILTVEQTPLNANDSFSPMRAIFRKLVHFFSFHFILNRQRTTTTTVSGLKLTVPPTVFHPKIFLTSEIFADYLQSLDLRGLRAVEVGTGSGILALSAAKAGADYVLALDINPQAVKAAEMNAKANGLTQVEARESNLFSAVPETEQFDVIISNPPYLSGEPRNTADRAWHAGPGYRDILGLFDQAAKRMKADGKFIMLVSSDTNMPLFNSLIDQAGLVSKEISTHSIFVEKFIIHELRKR